MKATFHQLEVFECVARRLSFTRAAEELSLSQPTVSAQIRALTDAVGMPLFEQVGKTISLTAAGRELLTTSRSVFEHWSRFEMTIDDLRGLKRGVLRVACSTTAKYFVPGLLGPFCRQYPEIDVRLEIANRARLVERLRDNLDDLTIMVQPPADVDVDATPFRDNALVAIAPVDHALANLTRVPLARLRDEPFVMRESGSGTRFVAERHFEAAGFSPQVRMELGSNEAVKHAVAAGLGLAVVSADALDVEPALDGLAILDLEGFPLVDQWQVVQGHGRRLSVVARAFHDFILAEASKPRGERSAARLPRAA
jgi:DNA-binding transcriptional LysR family regulator